jgi:hypothetical protein
MVDVREHITPLGIAFARYVGAVEMEMTVALKTTVF